jgi:hypothetical protein
MCLPVNLIEIGKPLIPPNDQYSTLVIQTSGGTLRVVRSANAVAHHGAIPLRAILLYDHLCTCATGVQNRHKDDESGYGNECDLDSTGPYFLCLPNPALGSGGT